ncbi:MAG: hypothetical protein IPQ25_02605 [Chitinophagaceae bacterium]|nr:hypothetical protein [Chitinophagaceae bacterium]
MRTKAKQISGIFFTLLGLVPLLFILLITLKKHDIRHRMKEKIGQQQLQTIVLSEAEVIWMDKHEIWVNNSMFDIHTKNLDTGIYTFTGLYDEEETMLVEKERTAAGENNDQTKLLAQLFKCLPVFCNQDTDIVDLNFQYNSYNQIVHPNPIYQFREILTPPPKV